jgi:hypothetical protein
VTDLVEKDTANIGDGDAMRNELEWTAIGIEDGGPIKERVRLQHVRPGARIEGDRQRTRAKRLAKNGIRKHD